MHSNTIATPAGPFEMVEPRHTMPSRLGAMAFQAKACVFRMKRALRDPNGKKPRRFDTKPVDSAASVISQSRSFLHASGRPEEKALQAGKIENLRKVARYLNGIVIPKGEVFSFWAHVPRPTKRRGFVKGRELREGCIIPSVGGGLCQASNALYQAAMDAGFEIVERHGHSRVLPGSTAAQSRDATIFWNYVDLRFRANAECQLEVLMGRDELIVRFRGVADPVSKSRPSQGPSIGPRSSSPVDGCETCGVTKCFRNHASSTGSPGEITAWLVDAWWPEHDNYLRKNHRAGDWLFTPVDSRRFGIGPYRWSSADFASVRQAPIEALHRSIRSRKLAAQGAARQRLLLEMDGKLARRYLRKLPCHATHLIISQNLLPFLWREGALGGRTFDVLMTRLPMRELHRTLDIAADRWPASPTLADFRAPSEIIDAETQALAAARQWITPHSAISRLAGPRAVKLNWRQPAPARETITRSRAAILFPASTLARKGACEVRAAARELGLKVLLGGPILEDPAFWEGLDTAPFDLTAGAWPRDIIAVVHPAWVENQPRRLLSAASLGLPVIASKNCGLAATPGITETPAGDPEALIAQLAALLPLLKA